jgi:branched-chain amino acid transport system ATP-binding protein
LVTSALALENVDAFYGDSHVLHGVSFSLGEGRLLGLLGRNGAGKSTCMSTIVGLLPPKRGDVSVFGETVSRMSPELIANRGVALVPQGRRIFRSLTVRENLIVAARNGQGQKSTWTEETVLATIAARIWPPTFPAASNRCLRSAGR